MLIELIAIFCMTLECFTVVRSLLPHFKAEKANFTQIFTVKHNHVRIFWYYHSLSSS